MPFRVDIRAAFGSARFRCQRCGSCCHHRRPDEFEDLVPPERQAEFWAKSNLIYLTEKDIDKISRKTGLAPEEFVDTLYDEKKGSVRVEDGGKKVILDLPVMKSRESDGACVFFEEGKGCTIYPVRPTACRLFPFVVVEKSGPSGGIILEIKYNPTCPGMGKGKEPDRRKLEKLVGDQFAERMEAIGPKVQRLRMEGKILPDARIYRTMPGKRRRPL
ncbi:MAG TPA: YkgJ family cysteine cluster protein [Methanothrix sp.]|mgnify:FL=1|nr:YkgJ family cysteine cluster protein [Methanothrix sp.]HPJ84393.1 YkgJ family cysteine cluster protein [Methanothrix sp.]HPR67248.1 YkgJ family cysteine cluster protein [Methanothrix sp.]